MLADEFTGRVTKYAVKRLIGENNHPVAGAGQVDAFRQAFKDIAVKMQYLLSRPALGDVVEHHQVISGETPD